MSSPHLFTVDEWHQMGTLDAVGADAIEALPRLTVAVADVLAADA